MFPVTANMLFTVYEYKGLRPDSMDGDYKSPPQDHWMAYPMERSDKIRHNNKRDKKNPKQPKTTRHNFYNLSYVSFVADVAFFHLPLHL